MHLGSIKSVSNGFVLEDVYGNVYIAKTLMEAAKLAGEAVPDSGYIRYAQGFDSNDLNNVKHHWREDRKIDAIKLMRQCFVPALGLKEAKELLEVLCSG